MAEKIIVVPDECIDAKVQRLRELVTLGSIDQPIIIEILDDLESAMRTLSKIEKLSNEIWMLDIAQFDDGSEMDDSEKLSEAIESAKQIGWLCCGGMGNRRARYALWY